MWCISSVGSYITRVLGIDGLKELGHFILYHGFDFHAVNSQFLNFVHYHIEPLSKVIEQLLGILFHLEFKLLKFLFEGVLELVPHLFHFGALFLDLELELMLDGLALRFICQLEFVKINHHQGVTSSINISAVVHGISLIDTLLHGSFNNWVFLIAEIEYSGWTAFPSIGMNSCHDSHWNHILKGLCIRMKSHRCGDAIGVGDRGAIGLCDP